MNKSFIEFDCVSFKYGDRTLLNKISLSIPENKLTVVLGPNGTGKTTFIHLALGWLKPDSGTIKLKGTELSKISSRKRGQIVSLLPQTEAPNFEYTVMEYILLGRAPHLGILETPGDKDLLIATNALRTAGIYQLKEKPIPTLSGGESQLMLLSRSLTQQPEALMLDEPTNHLDLKNKRQIVNLLRQWKDNGKTALLTTHDPETAAHLADHLIMFSSEGEIISGPFKEVFTEDILSRIYNIPIKIELIKNQYFVLWYN